MNPVAIVAATGISNYTNSFFAGVNASAAAAAVPQATYDEMDAWWGRPCVMPSPVSCIDLYIRGFMGEDLLTSVCRNHGVNLIEPREDAKEHNARAAWRCVVNGMVHRPSIEWVMNQWARGYWNQDSPEAERTIKQAGGDPRQWKNYVTAFYDTPPMATLMEGRLRGLLTDEQFNDGMKRHGFGNSHHRDLYRGLLKVNPPPADWIHFAVKEALSPDIASAAGLYDQFPAAISEPLKWQGLGWKLDFTITSDGQRRRATVADLYWAAHWQPYSATQVIAMFQQHRAGRLDRFAGTGLNVIEVNAGILDRWLRINDYPPELRDNLAALAFVPLRLVDVRNALAMNYRVLNDPNYAATLPLELRQRALTYDRAWAIEQFRDRGHVPLDAGTQADLALAAAIQQATREQRNARLNFQRQFRRDIMRACELGTLTRERAVAGLVQTGVAPETAGNMADLAEVHRTEATARAGVAATRRGYLSGYFSEVQAEENLLAAGIDNDAADEYIRRWRMEFNSSRRQFTTSQIVRHLAEGRITPQQARTRLTNLGWIDPDRLILLSEAQGRSLQLRARAIRAADSDRRRRASELNKVQRELVKAQESVRSALRREIPIGKLQALVRKGIINSVQFLRRAVAAGYSQTAANAFLADALTPNPRPIYPKTPAELTTNPAIELGGERQPPAGPAAPPPPATQPQPPAAERPRNATQAQPTPSGPLVLSTPPRVLNTPPERLGEDGGPLP